MTIDDHESICWIDSNIKYMIQEDDTVYYDCDQNGTLDFFGFAYWSDPNNGECVTNPGKYGLIKDLNFFNWLKQEYESILNHDKNNLQMVISKSCKIKAEIIKNDEKEGAERALLNLGHTFAHAIESFGNFDGRVIHGEAVSIGICLAFKLSNKLCFCSKDDTEKVVNLFQKSELPTSLNDIKSLSISTSGMIEKFKFDKIAAIASRGFLLASDVSYN